MTNMTMEKVAPKPFITDAEIKAVFNISQPTLWRWTKKLGFPPAVVGMKGKRPYQMVLDWARDRGVEWSVEGC
ncbi:MAG: helix-turn-helix transcriptional regulator [Vibrio sp.]